MGLASGEHEGEPGDGHTLATSAQNSNVRRGKRSETAPPTSKRATWGAEVARPT